MKSIKLLDCTLRDGGFVNNWNFGHGDIINLFERSVSAGIDYIEVGFLDEREEFDINRTITPDTTGMNEIFKGLDHGRSKIFGMIDYGTCSLDKICDAKDSVLDGIRVMIKKPTRYEAINFCAELKKKGYIVFAQPVSITGYSDEEMIDLIEHINEAEPAAMAIVDTYGLLDRSSLLHYFHLIDEHLKKEITVGYHAHNNFQLAYSNSMALCEEKTERSLILDGSAYGIGKSAGNCPLELLCVYMNHHFEADYDTSQILEMIDTGIMKIYEKFPWGYQMQYFLCASNDCHPKYPQYLLKKKTLSVQSVNEILSMIIPEERLAFNEAYIEKLYIEYQNNEINDDADRIKLKNKLAGKKILILGPGHSMLDEKKEICRYISENAPEIISINYKPDDFYPNYIFLSNSKRYMQLSNSLQSAGTDIKIMATSNVTAAKGEFDFSFDYSTLIDREFEIPDNSLPMLLRLLEKIGVKDVALAGFDGYSVDSRADYINPDMAYEFISNYAVKL
ncbi:MAG: aldolase catalytic domain-containing protein, partial [Lachnospiraceae bacterium]|nr:aldolase catalytic domain-containing protein [Lachnospiraceae bacterium]